ncbi:hypothetical protein [Roseibium sp. MMSF_3412]|uniref:hypothetical protein n=1 Tax=Roseibium sp. MMSF_3412 TaxID=3046712 RepID=UPI00273D1A26|nr:hypothetical protein [Roseibium sp. MMSF_3412]
MPEVSLNYEEIKWTYETLDRSNGGDTFDFNFKNAGSKDAEEGFDPEFSADGASGDTDIAIEELTIAHEHIERPHDADTPFFDDFFA